jgi:hypothetical protein
MLILGVLLAQWCVCGPICVLADEVEASAASECCSGCPDKEDAAQKESSCECYMCLADIVAELAETAESFHIDYTPCFIDLQTVALTTLEAPIRKDTGAVLPPGPPVNIAFGIQLI